MSKLSELSAAGTAVWLDFVDRKFLAAGGLGKLVEADGADRRDVEPVDLRKGDGAWRCL